MNCIYFRDDELCTAGENYYVDGDTIGKYCKSEHFPQCLRYNEYNKHGK